MSITQDRRGAIMVRWELALQRHSGLHSVSSVIKRVFYYKRMVEQQGQTLAGPAMDGGQQISMQSICPHQPTQAVRVDRLSAMNVIIMSTVMLKHRIPFMEMDSAVCSRLMTMMEYLMAFHPHIY